MIEDTVLELTNIKCCRDRGGAARSNNTKTPDRETRGDQANGGGGAAAKEECEGVYKNAR